MTRKIMLIAAMSQTIEKIPDCDYIGIDRGALTAIRQNIPLLCAIGDFDSISSEERDEIAIHCPIEVLPTHKDETDSEKGIFYALEHGYDEIILYGALGGRMDHTTANLSLLIHRELPLVLMDEHHYIRKLKKGNYLLPKRFTYLSFLALEKTIISETGVAYPLEMRTITPQDIYPISNEIIADYAQITIHEGSVLMIQCEDI